MLTSKLPTVGTTIFTIMSGLAAKHGAINLGQGFPDFDVPQRLLDALTRAVHAGHNQYPPMAGIAPLREAIARKTRRVYGHAPDPDTEITVTSGATEALFNAIHAVAGVGDEVIVLDPAYDSYAPAIALAGARAVHVPLRTEDFRPDWQLTPRTRLLIINSPHNPTGAVLNAEDIAALHTVLDASGIWLLSDEVYEHIVFDGARHESILRYPALRERAFVVSSFGKTYHCTGWKLGYCIANFARFTSSTPFAASPRRNTPLPKCSIPNPSTISNWARSTKPGATASARNWQAPVCTPCRCRADISSWWIIPPSATLTMPPFAAG